MFTRFQQNAAQHRMIRLATKPSKNVANFKYLGTKLTQKNS
jgi:hypothetical protein